MSTDRRAMVPSRSPGRREALRSLVGGSLLLPGICSELFAADDPLAPKPSHFPAKAKRIIFLLMSGGVSQMDSFDFKPRLFADAGRIVTAKGSVIKGPRKLLPPNWQFQPGGKCGTMVSDLFPHIRGCMDDIAVIRSMRSDHVDHVQSTLGIHTGSVSVTRPSIGSWVSYGLGTMNKNLPSFVVIAPKLPYGGTQVLSNDFLPPYHQGTRVVPGPEPIPNLTRRYEGPDVQAEDVSLMRTLNKLHLQKRDADSTFAARVRSFETAYGMQVEAGEAFDLSKESDATLELYGLERGQNDGFGWQCLVSRRLAERGVRFIELIDCGSAKPNWDTHSKMEDCAPLAKNVDRPIAGLLRDLKARGLLEDTLVVWTTEFGRTSYEDGPGGRQHHERAFCSWMAGAGVKPGIAYGQTDEHGMEIAEKKVHVHDFHATILHLLGLDHTRLTYRHAGRDFRLTDVHGEVVRGILS
jgi:hypothetical protein